MPLYKTEAIVIRTIKLGEADKIATLFTNELGKVRAVAKGVRRTKSRFRKRLRTLHTYKYRHFYKREQQPLQDEGYRHHPLISQDQGGY